MEVDNWDKKRGKRLLYMYSSDIKDKEDEQLVLRENVRGLNTKRIMGSG